LFVKLIVPMKVIPNSLQTPAIKDPLKYLSQVGILHVVG
jgi:hypothetical protein